jgi:hypothetical protein
MTRRALLVGNSVTYSDLSKSITRPIMQRTIHRLQTLLTELDSDYAFDVSTCIDERGGTVIRRLEEIAKRAAKDGDLLLFYYFGHGDLSPDLKLLLLHRGSKKGVHDQVGLELLETRILEEKVPKSLFLLDCCYAGGVERTFPHSLRGDHCRIAATAPSSKAYVMSGNVEDPIGVFTSAFMESFTTPDACVSNADNRVTAASLFNYLKDTLAKDDRSRSQKPSMQGSLPDALFEYQSTPNIHRAYSSWADEKTGYAKIFVICRALAGGNFKSIFALHGFLIKHYRKSFQTLYKEADGTFVYRPVSHTVVARYVGLMRRIGLMGDAAFELSPRGRSLASHWQSRGNELLLESVDTYLTGKGMSRDELVDATRRVLLNRRIPTKHEVADMLSLTSYRLPKWDVGVLLDLLAYAGSLRVAEQRAYFPW